MSVGAGSALWANELGASRLGGALARSLLGGSGGGAHMSDEGRGRSEGAASLALTSGRDSLSLEPAPRLEGAGATSLPRPSSAGAGATARACPPVPGCATAVGNGVAAGVPRKAGASVAGGCSAIAPAIADHTLASREGGDDNSPYAAYPTPPNLPTVAIARPTTALSVWPPSGDAPMARANAVRGSDRRQASWAGERQPASSCSLCVRAG